MLNRCFTNSYWDWGEQKHDNTILSPQGRHARRDSRVRPTKEAKGQRGNGLVVAEPLLPYTSVAWPGDIHSRYFGEPGQIFHHSQLPKSQHDSAAWHLQLYKTWKFNGHEQMELEVGERNKNQPPKTVFWSHRQHI